MTTFELQLSRWNAAERQAQAAQHGLAAALDRYCEGRGPAPSREAIAQAHAQRDAASLALRNLWKTQAHVRRDLRVL
jgi:hypothetical protein